MTDENIIQIGKRRIGRREDVYVIAEAGVNHNGDIACAHHLIDAAQASGADAVKFQLFSAERLVSTAAPACSYQRKNDPSATDQYTLLKHLELSSDAFVELKHHADEAEIDFLATPFGIPELDFLVNILGVPALKIASTDLINVPLMTAALESKRPILVSTGASVEAEVDQVVERVRRGGAEKRLILLHCVSSYPASLNAARLRCIATLHRRYGVLVGFSDHTDEVATGGYAVLAGAVVVEKHLTLDRTASGPDHFFSLEPTHMATYIAGIRQAQTILGDGDIDCTPEEFEVRELARGHIVTKEAIAAGEQLNAGALTIKRPGQGISPLHWDDLIGRVARTAIPADTALCWSMLEGG